MRQYSSVDEDRSSSTLVRSGMLFELMLINHGVTLPVGGSLLIVAQASGIRSPDRSTTA